MTQAMLSEESYRQLQQEAARGEIELKVAHDIARQFYLVTSRREIRHHTGRSELTAKLAVYLGVLLTPTLAGLCLLQIVYHHGWWAAVVIPIAGILWTVIAGFLNPVGPMWTITVAAAAALVVYLFGWVEMAIAIPALLWTLSLWVNRLTYVLAGFFLRRLLLASYAAYEMLCDHVEIRSISAP